jgi:predicted dehydrogenase
MIRIGVIGYGYWGPNIVRNFSELPDAEVVAVCDRKPERLALAKRRNPAISVTMEPWELFSDSSIDAIVIATPVLTHHELACAALKSGKHVLVEKPMCSSGADAARLIDLADACKLTLMVDHTFVYTGAVRKMRDLISDGSVGGIFYYDSVRINLGLFQSDVSVVWDLAVHDLAIMDYLLDDRKPSAVACTGSAHVNAGVPDVAYLTLYFSDSLIAHVHVNWLAPVKLRRTIIGGSLKMLVYDDLEPYEKVRVHDKGIVVTDQEELHRLRAVGYRSGDVWSPAVDMTEALRVEAKHFLRCVEGLERPITDGLAGFRVVSLLEAASKSLDAKGAPVDVCEMETV